MLEWEVSMVQSRDAMRVSFELHFAPDTRWALHRTRMTRANVESSVPRRCENLSESATTNHHGGNALADGVTTFDRQLRRRVVWILSGLLALAFVAMVGCGSGSAGTTDATVADSATTAPTTGEARVNSNNPRVEFVTSMGTIVL